jgi:uncharacterized protein
MGKMLRILQGSDFHGSTLVFRKFISAAFQYDAKVLIVAGDVTGKAMVPIIHQDGGKYEGHLFNRKEEPSTPEELDKFKQTISNVGFYPIVMEPDEAKALESDEAAMGKRFEREMCLRVGEWMALAEEKLTPKGISLYFMPGNDDLDSIDDVIDEFPNIHNPDNKHLIIQDGYEMIGVANANMTPWLCNRDIPEEDITKKLEKLAAQVQNPERTIAVIHVPPIDSGLDICPDLDENLKLITRGGQVMMKSAGSTAVRSFVESFQPMLSLHGHIHESAAYTHIGRTLSINAGSEYAEGIMKAAIINLEGDKVKGHMLISG